MWKAASPAEFVEGQNGAAGRESAAGFEILEVTLHHPGVAIPLAHQALDRFAAEHGVPPQWNTPLHLALEEHLTNIVAHGFKPGQAGTIWVRFAKEPTAILIEIEDDAGAFNPTEAPEVNTALPLDAKPLGGLGVHILRKSVDELEYRRTRDRNVLTIRKRL